MRVFASACMCVYTSKKSIRTCVFAYIYCTCIIYIFISCKPFIVHVFTVILYNIEL